MTVTDSGRRSLDDVLAQARQLVGDGPVPTKEQLRKTLQVHWKRAEAVHEMLTAQRAELRQERHRNGRAKMSKLRSRRGNSRPVVVRAPVFRPSSAPPISAVQPRPAEITGSVVPVDGEKTSAWLPQPSTECLPNPPAEPVDTTLEVEPAEEVRKTSPVPAGPSTGTRKRAKTWPVLLLLLPASVAIWAGWVDLGRLTGFGMVTLLPGISDFQLNTAITLPVGMETYAAYALYVWLASVVPPKARQFAKWSAIGSLALGAAGQVTYHLMAAAGMTKAPWPITMLVACLPVAVLGMGAALAHLVRAEDPA